VVVAADGDALAVAWRPLLAPAGRPLDTGSPSRPPAVSFPAEVRVLTVSTDAKPRLVSRYPTTVQPPAWVTGHGPWPLQPGGAWGFTLADRATFLWLDPATRSEVPLVAAQVHDPRPTVLVPDSFDTLWVPTPVSGATSVVVHAYRSAPDFRTFEISCAPRQPPPGN
jgi:hypothetical protein